MSKRRGEDTRDKILASAQSLIMAKGFAAASIDDIIRDAALTKGAFFHHFKSKGDLARELVEWHARNDLAMFEAFAAKAERESDDPLEQMMIFLRSFEDFISNSKDPSPGCMYAVYTYESTQFDPSVMDIVADTLRQWTSIYVRKFQDILDLYQPALPVTARQLAELIVSIIEGGLVLQRAYEEVEVTRRQSQQFRNYLELLFRESAAKRRRDSKRRSAPGRRDARGSQDRD